MNNYRNIAQNINKFSRINKFQNKQFEGFLNSNKVNYQFTSQKEKEKIVLPLLQQDMKNQFGGKLSSLTDIDYKLIFPKRKKKAPEQTSKLAQHQQIFQQQEEMQQKTNIQLLFRELKNDSLQLPIKTLAYMAAPISLQSTFYAELIRSGIDAINHLILLITNYIPIGPTLKYPYGIEKLKNTVVLIPAALFMFMGGELLFQQIETLLYFKGTSIATESHYSNITSMLLYVASIGIEMTVIYKNLIDAKNLDDGSKLSEVQKNSNFLVNGFNLLKEVLTKKDPVLQAILFENMITFLSTSIPLTCQIIMTIFQSHYVEVIGSSVIGIIQLYLGFHLAQKNLEHVVGEKGIEQSILDDIIKITKQNQYITDIKDEKAVMIGSKKFRFQANIEFDIQNLNTHIMKEYNSLIERVIYQPTYIDRRDELNDIIISVPSKVLKQIQQSINEIENNIMEKYPNCTHVDLEIDNNKLLTIFDEYESYRSFHESEHLKSKLTGKNLKIQNQFTGWIDEEVDKILGDKDYIKNIKLQLNSHIVSKYNKDLKPLSLEQYKQTDTFYDNNFSLNFIEEYRILNKEPRILTIRSDVENFENNQIYDPDYKN